MFVKFFCLKCLRFLIKAAMQHVLRTQLLKTSKTDMFQHSSFVVSFYFF